MADMIRLKIREKIVKKTRKITVLLSLRETKRHSFRNLKKKKTIDSISFWSFEDSVEQQYLKHLK